jgi:hypothetical protein
MALEAKLCLVAYNWCTFMRGTLGFVKDSHVRRG